MRIIWIILMVVTYSSCDLEDKSQQITQDTNFTCKMLVEILKEKEIQTIFRLDLRDKLETIYVVDTTNNINSCRKSRYEYIADTELLFTTNLPNIKIYNKQAGIIEHPKYDYISIFKLEQYENDYDLILIREAGGDLINVKFHISNKEIVISKLQMGNI